VGPTAPAPACTGAHTRGAKLVLNPAPAAPSQAIDKLLAQVKVVPKDLEKDINSLLVDRLVGGWKGGGFQGDPKRGF
jgi:hypothetical protein